MKKSLLFIFFVLFALTSFAQSHLPMIGVTREELNEDTIRTFSLINTDHDKSIQKLLAALGEPVKNTPGNITWQKISIPNVGDSLTIELYDGIVMVLPNKARMFKTFRDENDKAQRLKNLPPTDHRVTDIIIFSSDRKKIIITQPLENAVMQYLETLLKAN
jgi:hypothetical protein